MLLTILPWSLRSVDIPTEAGFLKCRNARAQCLSERRWTYCWLPLHQRHLCFGAKYTDVPIDDQLALMDYDRNECRI